MNGVHDLGGMENMGPVAPEPGEPVFHHRWESRVHALVVASPTRRNIDEGRHQRELIPGPVLLAMSYYEKWFTGLRELLVKYGHATPQEIEAGQAGGGGPHFGEGRSAKKKTIGQNFIPFRWSPPPFHPHRDLLGWCLPAGVVLRKQ